MIRIAGVTINGKFGGYEIDSLSDILEDLEAQISDGVAVLYVAKIEDVADFGIDPDNVVMIYPDED